MTTGLGGERGLLLWEEADFFAGSCCMTSGANTHPVTRRWMNMPEELRPTISRRTLAHAPQKSSPKTCHTESSLLRPRDLFAERTLRYANSTIQLALNILNLGAALYSRKQARRFYFPYLRMLQLAPADGLQAGHIVVAAAAACGDAL